MNIGNRRFQFRLLTLVVASVLVALFLVINLCDQYEVEYHWNWKSSVPLASVLHRGWPFTYLVVHDQVAMRDGGNTYDATRHTLWYFRNLVFDVVCCALIIGLLTLNIEFALRRRAAESSKHAA